MKYILKFSLFLILTIFSVMGFIFGHNLFMKKMYPIKYESPIKLSCEKYGIDPALVLAMIRTESKFNKDVKSSAGAVGLMQLMPETFKNLQKNINGGQMMDEEYLEKPEINIEYGVYFLSELLKKYKSEEIAIVAYNAGSGRVDQWLSNEDLILESGIIKNIPFKETEDYLDRVSKSKEVYKNLYFK